MLPLARSLCKNTAAAILSVSLCLLLSGPASAADIGVELGADDDLTVLGTGGTATDPDTEIKGFTVFGSTQVEYTGALVGPGNVVVNGVLAVSSGAYFVGNSTFTSAGKIFINDGSAGQLLRRNAAGYLEWADSSSLGDNLGNHIATTTLDMGTFNIVNVSSVNFLPNVFLVSATAAQHGGVYVSTNLYVAGISSATAYYGDGSALTGIAGASGPSIDVSTINATATTPYGGVNITTNTYVQGKLGVNTLTPQYALEVSSSAGASGTLLAVSTGTSIMAEIKGTGEIVSRKLTVNGGPSRISNTVGDISVEPAGSNLNVTKNITVASDMNVGFKGPSGDTYMKYDSDNNWIRIYLGGVELARFKQ